MTALFNDLRFALRLFAKAPGFAAAAILSLALGIGANTTVYTWMNNLLRDPLPGVSRSGELLVLVNSDANSPAFDVSYPDFLDLARETRTLDTVSASRWSVLNLGEAGSVERAYGQVVSGSFFRVVGITPALGRLLGDEDDQPGGPQTLVISHALWQRKFGGQASVLGHTLRINGMPRTIVGVAPRGFEGTIGGLCFDAWLPLRPFLTSMDSAGMFTNRRNRCMFIMARPRPGATLAQVQGDLTALGRDLERRYPEDNRGMKVRVLPISASIQGVQSIAAQPLSVLAVAVALLLLIACVNVANLLMARAAGRERELAIRQALGAGRGRVIRQLLTESLVLGVGGGAAGFLLSLWSAGLLQRLAPPTYLPLTLRTGTSAKAMVFAFGLSLAASLLFGLIPALRTSGSRLAGALRDGSRGSGGPRLRRFQGALVVIELGLAVMLLVAAGLLVRSFQHTLRADPGFDARNILVAGFGLENTGYNQVKTAQVGRDILDHVRALPGVRGAAMSQELVMGFEGNSWDYFQVEGRDEAPGERLRFDRNVVTPGFFEAMGIPLAAGRDLLDTDLEGTQPVVVVNETLAGRCWPGQDPLGKRLRSGGQLWTVVGVCRSFHHRTWTAPVVPFVYFPSAQRGDEGFHVLYVRTYGVPGAVAPALRGVLKAVDPDLPLLLDSLERIVDSSAWDISLAAKVLGAMGLLAAVLAAVGIYGVMATSVSQRIPEFGIRMSLGADSARILGLVLRQGGTLVALGVVLGLAGAMILTRGLANLLMGLPPTDPAVFLLVPALLACTALCACATPAYRASRVNPLQALRQE